VAAAAANVTTIGDVTLGKLGSVETKLLNPIIPSNYPLMLYPLHWY